MTTKLETACGWKGSLRKSSTTSISSSTTSITSTATGSSTMKDSLERTEGSSPCSSQDEETDDFDDSLFLGGEPNLLDVDVERRGVRTILATLSESEKDQLMAFDTTMPIRHLRAEKGDVPKAVHQIRETLQWRSDFGVDVIVSCFQVEDTDQDTPAHQEMRTILSQETAPGKVYTRGYDTQGRAFLFMTPARENTNHELNNMRHLVFHLEKAIACTARKSMEVQQPPQQGQPKGRPLEKVNAIIDYEGFKIRNAPPMSTTQYTLDILQKHYPERMLHFYLLHPPLVFQVFWAMIKHFVDPVTKEKIVFCSGKNHTRKLLDHVTEVDKLEPRAYGSNPNLRPFDAEEYLRLPFNVSFDE